MKISVIMPTFNAAKYIKTSLDSLMAQSFKDFEVIVVDSGSTDGTVDILSLYNRYGLTMRVIAVPELAPALARNIGIENASGEYLAFCDSDDIMKPDMLKTLFEAALVNDADITVCDFDMVYPDKTIEGFTRLSDERYKLSKDDTVDYYYRFCGAPKPNNYVWSRLYKRSFLLGNNLKFPSTRYSEDHLLNMNALFKSPRILHIGKSLYKYMQYDDSAMRRYIRQTNYGLLFLEGFRKAGETLEDKDKAITEQILAIYAYTRVKSIIFYAWQAKLSNNEILNAVSVFSSDGEVKRHLALCNDRGYIGRYCRLHGFSNEWEKNVRAMLYACIDGSVLPDMSEVFA